MKSQSQTYKYCTNCESGRTRSHALCYRGPTHGHMRARQVDKVGIRSDVRCSLFAATVHHFCRRLPSSCPHGQLTHHFSQRPTVSSLRSVLLPSCTSAMLTSSSLTGHERIVNAASARSTQVLSRLAMRVVPLYAYHFPCLSHQLKDSCVIFPPT